MKKMFKSRRGNISVTILVMGVFVVCSLALVSFYYSIGKTSFNFVGVDLIEKMNFQIEAGDIDNSDLKMIDREWNFYQEKKARAHIYSLTKDKLLFSVKYLVP